MLIKMSRKYHERFHYQIIMLEDIPGSFTLNSITYSKLTTEKKPMVAICYF